MEFLRPVQVVVGARRPCQRWVRTNTGTALGLMPKATGAEVPRVCSRLSSIVSLLIFGDGPIPVFLRLQYLSFPTLASGHVTPPDQL